MSFPVQHRPDPSNVYYTFNPVNKQYNMVDLHSLRTGVTYYFFNQFSKQYEVVDLTPIILGHGSQFNVNRHGNNVPQARVQPNYAQGHHAPTTVTIINSNTGYTQKVDVIPVVNPGPRQEVGTRK